MIKFFRAPIHVRLRQVSRTAAAFAMALTGLSLLCWTLNQAQAERFLPFPLRMGVNTDVALFLCGLSLWLLADRRGRWLPRLGSRICAVLMLSLGLATLFEFMTGRDLGIDHLLRHAPKDFLGAIPDRPALLTVLNLVLFSLALLLVDWKFGRGYLPSQVLLLASLVISLLAVIGYICRMPAYYTANFVEPGSQICLTAALIFTVLGVGMFCARPHQGLMRLLTSDTAGGFVTRRLLFAPILIPFVLGSLHLAGARAGLLRRDLSIWLFAVANILAFIGAVWWNALVLYRTDVRRRKAEKVLKRFNNELEARVAERTAQLNALNRELQQEVADRKHAEAEFQRLTNELEHRVAERTAQLEASNKELESFSYSVSHDLRAPLRSIDGFTHALQEEIADLIPPAAREYLTIVRQSSMHMGHLIDDLLHLSRLNRSEIHPGEVNLSALVQRIVADLLRAEPDRKVELVLSPELTVRADERLLSVAMQNLLSNAWKFTKNLPLARIEVGAERNNGSVAYFVKDNGAGFDMAYSDKLFRAFHRLHATKEFPGHGIGLATVHRIITRHGGKVWARAEPNRGATFYFSLPP